MWIFKGNPEEIKNPCDTCEHLWLLPNGGRGCREELNCHRVVEFHGIKRFIAARFQQIDIDKLTPSVLELTAYFQDGNNPNMSVRAITEATKLRDYLFQSFSQFLGEDK